MPTLAEYVPRQKFRWIDFVGLIFLLGLAVLPPLTEIHKQLTLLAIGLFQLFESRLIVWHPDRGRAYSVLIKILLATLLLGHTGTVGINSNYWPIYFLPVVTAAVYFGPLGALGWTALASLAYCSYLIPAVVIEDYEIPPSGYGILGIRILFLFSAAILINRFAIEIRRQMARYQTLSETLAESNRKLQHAQAEVRRSERLAALGQLSAGLAHEIRNPLGIIKGSAEMLQQKLGASQPAASELSGYISAEVNRLNALVSRFLDFARPSRLELKPADIHSIINRAVEIAQHRYPQMNVSIERHFAENLPPLIADEQLCEQIFVNLILNAYEAMGAANASDNSNPGAATSAAGAPILPPVQPPLNRAELRPAKISIAVAPASNNGLSGIAAEIADSGPGIPEDFREQIFNPFVSSKKTGVGLGLSIVAKIVDDHGGTIQLISRVGEGARFRVFLPAADGLAVNEVPKRK
ncbi:MAG TPA: ATP-binding protein [Candidatus Acidoferrales bacterium]|nr:ATP-binding protein [Candidatus Acidoferrales bacterium]